MSKSSAEKDGHSREYLEIELDPKIAERVLSLGEEEELTPFAMALVLLREGLASYRPKP